MQIQRKVLARTGRRRYQFPAHDWRLLTAGQSSGRARRFARFGRRTKEVEALIAGSYLAGTNTRRVGRALASLFRGAIIRAELEPPPPSTKRD